MAERELYFLDTEFMEDGRTIELVSIGIVTLEGREFYRCSLDADLDKASDWVRANVISKLPPKTSRAWASRAAIRDALRDFVKPTPKPRFWGYYSAYDWVVLCQLFGRMIDLPQWFPNSCMDLKQLSDMRGSPRHPKQDPAGAHDALADAKWNRELFRFLWAQSVVAEDKSVR